jgi:hypothetical protein
MRIRIEGHHNSEFRDAYRTVKATGKPETDLIKALMTGINYEAGYKGWYDEDSGAYFNSSRVRRAVEELVHKAYNGMEASDVEIVVHAIDVDDKQEDKLHGLIIWINLRDQVYGFGEAWTGDVENSLTIRDTDKYENRWVSFA